MSYIVRQLLLNTNIDVVQMNLVALRHHREVITFFEDVSFVNFAIGMDTVVFATTGLLRMPPPKKDIDP
jgi:hypothetical protein